MFDLHFDALEFVPSAHNGDGCGLTRSSKAMATFTLISLSLNLRYIKAMEEDLIGLFSGLIKSSKIMTILTLMSLSFYLRFMMAMDADFLLSSRFTSWAGLLHSRLWCLYLFIRSQNKKIKNLHVNKSESNIRYRKNRSSDGQSKSLEW